jgi:putative transposase
MFVAVGVESSGRLRQEVVRLRKPTSENPDVGHPVWEMRFGRPFRIIRWWGYSEHMTRGLVRKQQRGDLHFVTFSCFRRQPFLNSPKLRTLFEDALERMRLRYGFFVVGYVVMPEHVHLLVSEPQTGLLADALKALKLSVSLRSSERPFWSARYYDFNVFTEKKRIEKLKYTHRNPVVRGLVEAPEDWKWSSFLYYATGVVGTVEIKSEWTAAR